MSKSVSKFRKHKVYADDFKENYSEQEHKKRLKPRDIYRPVKGYDDIERLWHETESRRK